MNETGMIVYFDATASGPQILGLSTNCRSSMEMTNVIPSFDKDGMMRRRDLYLDITDEMYKIIDFSETVLDPDERKRRGQVKYPIMTTFYGSKKQPEDLFGKHTPDHMAFLEVMAQNLPGPMMLMEQMQSCWDSTALFHHWRMPNGAEVNVAVIDDFSGTVKMEANGKEVKLPFKTKLNKAYRNGLSLAANITHSVDNYIKDLVVLEFKRVGAPITCIHDCFGVHPNDVDFLMESYRNALVHVYRIDLIHNIMVQITGNHDLERIDIDPGDHADLIMKSRYALS